MTRAPRDTLMMPTRSVGPILRKEGCSTSRPEPANRTRRGAIGVISLGCAGVHCGPLRPHAMDGEQREAGPRSFRRIGAPLRTSDATRGLRRVRAATPEELPRTIAWHPGGGSFVAHRADSRTPDPGAAETAYLYAQGAEQPVELVPKHAGSSVTWRPREPIVFLHSGYGTGRFMSCPCSLRRMTSMPSDSDPQARETGDGEGHMC